MNRACVSAGLAVQRPGAWGNAWLVMAAVVLCNGMLPAYGLPQLHCEGSYVFRLQCCLPAASVLPDS